MITVKNLEANHKSDWDFAREVSREARQNPNSPYAGKFVGVSQQKVVAAADSPEELRETLQNAGFNPDEVMVIEVNVDHDRTYHIWECH